MTAHDAIVAKCSTMSDDQIADCILEINRQHDAMSTADRLMGDEAATLRLVRGAMLSVLEARYPWLDEILETWVEDATDDREYSQVVFDALSAEMILA